MFYRPCLICVQCEEVILDLPPTPPEVTTTTAESLTANQNSHLSTNARRVLPSASARQEACHYFKLCQKFKASLALPHQYLGDPKRSKCFCLGCYTNPDHSEKKGDPPKEYALPRGWVYVPIRQKQPKKSHEEDSNSAAAPRSTANWHRAYHGTKPGMIRKLLDIGELVPMCKLFLKIIIWSRTPQDSEGKWLCI